MSPTIRFLALIDCSIMTTHADVNQRYSELQTMLRDYLGADGRGIVEMVRSVEAKMSATLSWELRAIAHIRNKVVHEGLVEVPRYFEPLCKEAIAGMKKLKPKRATKAKQLPATPLISPSLFLQPVPAPKFIATPKAKAAAKPKSKAAPKRVAKSAKRKMK